MKKIMVFDVPAEHGGALTILNQYYASAVNGKDTKWIFVISTPDLKKTDNVEILKYPWVKKTWFHRLYFDKFVAWKLVDVHKPDEVLSLQNVTIPKIKIPQTLYLHQSLPFVEKRYGILENFKFWAYQNIISKMIFASIKEADTVIVQTKWIRDAAIEKTGVRAVKFVIKQPGLDIKIKNTYTEAYSKEKLFFYPASGLPYKNHELIVQACRMLSKEEIKNYRVIFTLKGDENKLIKRLYNVVKNENLPIEFIGYIGIDEVYNYYSKSILLFPSYIETFGLPLLEAREHGAPIFASDCAFSREILDGYAKATFFDYTKHEELANLIKAHLS